LGVALTVLAVAMIAVPLPPTPSNQSHPSANSASAGGTVSVLTPSWSQVVTPGQPLPNLIRVALAYDARDHYVVLFGLNQSVGVKMETWTYAAGNWTRLALKTQPSPRIGEALVYDPAAGYLVLFGGDSLQRYGFGCHNKPATSFCNDTWEFVRGRWIQLHPPGVSPPEAYGDYTYYAPAKGILLGGGYPTRSGPSGPIDQWWLYHGGSWGKVRLTSNSSNPIFTCQRLTGSVAYTPLSHRAIFIDGYSPNPALTQTWAYSARTWTRLNVSVAPNLPSPYPPGAGTSGMVFDPALNGTFLLQAGNWANQTWEFSANHWKRVALAVHPPAGAGYGFGATFDSGDGSILLFEFVSSQPETWILS
jgi:hypothetical protein